MAGETPAAVLARSGAPDLLGRGLSPNDLAAGLLAALRRMRYPATTSLEARFAILARELTRGSRVRLKPSQGFEADAVTVEVTVRGAEDLTEAAGRLAAMVGENTELDKAVIEQLNTPCIHLLRNAVDHGIELPDIRDARGKPRRGTITLSARQDGNDVMIVIADDGAGIDVERLWEKAVAAGMVDPDNRPAGAEALNLIFLPGLTTAAAVGAVSGRGVGMHSPAGPARAKSSRPPAKTGSGRSRS